jgi:anti-sigma B factor antagonist
VTVEAFKVEAAQTGETLQIRLIGEFDLPAFDQVDTLLTDAQRGNSHDVLVDLRGLTFIDSSGIRALVRAHKRGVEGALPLRLIRGPHNVHRVFELAGLDSRLDFVEGEPPIG